MHEPTAPVSSAMVPTDSCRRGSRSKAPADARAARCAARASDLGVDVEKAAAWCQEYFGQAHAEAMEGRDSAAPERQNQPQTCVAAQVQEFTVSGAPLINHKLAHGFHV